MFDQMTWKQYRFVNDNEMHLAAKCNSPFQHKVSCLSCEMAAQNYWISPKMDPRIVNLVANFAVPNSTVPFIRSFRGKGDLLWRRGWRPRSVRSNMAWISIVRPFLWFCAMFHVKGKWTRALMDVQFSGGGLSFKDLEMSWKILESWEVLYLMVHRDWKNV